jgi:hypothetical protein
MDGHSEIVRGGVPGFRDAASIRNGLRIGPWLVLRLFTRRPDAGRNP